MSKYKYVFKIFVTGQEEKECNWLSEMSKKGYHFVGLSGCAWYKFEKGKSKDYAYVIDMKEGKEKYDDEYFSIYKEYGLEYIDTSMNFNYFKSENIEDTKNIVNNERGRYIDRLSKHKLVILLAGILNLVIFVTNSINSYLEVQSFNYIYIINLVVGLWAIMIYFKTNKKIKDIKKEGVDEIYFTKFKDWCIFYRLAIFIAIVMIAYVVLNIVYYIS